MRATLEHQFSAHPELAKQASLWVCGLLAIFAECVSAPVDEIDLILAPDVYGDRLLDPLPETYPWVDLHIIRHVRRCYRLNDRFTPESSRSSDKVLKVC